MRVIACSQCRSPIPDTAVNLGAFVPCGVCGTGLRAEVFPALYRAAAAANPGEKILIEGEASCFFHPDKKAVLPCAQCGRFICALCDIELGDRHLCPACLESGRRQQKLPELEPARITYDRIALAGAIIPALFWPVSLITAPLVILYSAVTWRRPLSVVSRSRIRFVLAVALAVLEIAAWIAIFVAANHE